MTGRKAWVAPVCLSLEPRATFAPFTEDDQLDVAIFIIIITTIAISSSIGIIIIIIVMQKKFRLFDNLLQMLGRNGGPGANRCNRRKKDQTTSSEAILWYTIYTIYTYNTFFSEIVFFSSVSLSTPFCWQWGLHLLLCLFLISRGQNIRQFCFLRIKSETWTIFLVIQDKHFCTVWEKEVIPHTNNNS